MTDDIDVYDLRGIHCPLPVLKTRKRLRAMQVGQQLWVHTSDPLAVLDIPHFCREFGHALIETNELDDGHQFLIAKGDGDTAA